MLKFLSLLPNFATLYLPYSPTLCRNPNISLSKGGGYSLGHFRPLKFLFFPVKRVAYAATSPPLFLLLLFLSFCVYPLLWLILYTFIIYFLRLCLLHASKIKYGIYFRKHFIFSFTYFWLYYPNAMSLVLFQWKQRWGVVTKLSPAAGRKQHCSELFSPYV